MRPPKATVKLTWLTSRIEHKYTLKRQYNSNKSNKIKKIQQQHTQPVNFFLKTIEDILFPGAVFKSTYKISYHHHLHLHHHHHYEKCAIKKQVNI